MTLPEHFCWTRFGTEAGQTIEDIFLRKEQERLANNGQFLWGIGNAIGPSVKALLARTMTPEVIFSPMKATPRGIDVAPPGVVAWTVGETLEGKPFSLPECSLVTSRCDPAKPRGVHYALVCYSDGPLSLAGSSLRVNAANLRNLLTGRPVASSQVTAIVAQSRQLEKDFATYPIAIHARLVRPYFVRLLDPVWLGKDSNLTHWTDMVRLVWERRLASPARSETRRQQELIFDR